MTKCPLYGTLIFMNIKITEYYEKENGRIPYKEWYLSLNKAVKARVDVRIKRAEIGNYGFHKKLSEDIIELKFTDGTRIYFAEVDNKIILLLLGGGKSKQSNDIAKAQKYFKDYKERNL